MRSDSAATFAGLGFAAVVLGVVGCQVISGISDLEIQSTTGSTGPFMPPSSSGGPAAGGGGQGGGGDGGATGGGGMGGATGGGGQGGGGQGGGGQGGGGMGGGGAAPCGAVDCAPYACDETGTNRCFTACSTEDQCTDDAFCHPNQGEFAMDCLACGFAPPPPPDCGAGCVLPTCSMGTCATETNCVADLCTFTCAGCTTPGVMLTLQTMGRPAKLICNDGNCSNMTITCAGPNGCEVECQGDSCDNMTLDCDPVGGVGKCTLKCLGAGSCMNVTQNCPNNSCVAECAATIPVNQMDCGPPPNCCEKNTCT